MSRESNVLASGATASFSIACLPGDALGIHIDEDGNSRDDYDQPLTTTWRIEVFAETEEGLTYLGVVKTVPPWAQTYGDLNAYERGEHLNRLVAVAACPGARKYQVQVTPIRWQDGASARFTLSASRHHSAALPAGRGVQPITRTRTLHPQGDDVLASVRTLMTCPVRFRAAWGANESASKRWIMFFNTKPAFGDPPQPGNFTIPVFSVPVEAGATFSLEPFDTYYFDEWLVWAVSSTAGTLTFAASDDFNVVAQVEV